VLIIVCGLQRAQLHREAVVLVGHHCKLTTRSVLSIEFPRRSVLRDAARSPPGRVGSSEPKTSTLMVFALDLDHDHVVVGVDRQISGWTAVRAQRRR
jgi:hypothetical protein